MGWIMRLIEVIARTIGGMQGKHTFDADHAADVPPRGRGEYRP
jgi:hypothetical protein